MLPGATVGLLFGVWLFQQQPHLWSVSAWLGWLAALILIGCLAYGNQVIAARHIPYQHTFRKLFIIVLIAALGFAWAQLLAWDRLQTQLPSDCEQQVIAVQGVIVSVPERDARGQHVDFAVERSFTADCPMPKRVRLHLYHQSYRGESAKASPVLPILQAGERWQWSVRLKRPHATRNPHGFDYAAWCLSNNIGASGAIVSKTPMLRLQRLVWKPSALIAHWRAAVGNRIEKVLGTTPQSAVLRALVIGDDSQIARADWQLFVDTGINHLISISGLHITMLASMGYLLTGWAWRLRPRLALRIPSRLAAGVGGALVAIAYSALAGFSIPTERTLLMLLTMIVMLSLKQRLPFSWVLSAAVWVVLVVDPWAVMAPGFWLSFGAVTILAFAMSGRLRPARWWQSALQTQWVITLAFVPVLILLFNQLSLISPLANGLAIPIVSLAIVPLAIDGAILPLDFLLHLSATLWEWCAHGLHWLRQLPGAVCYLSTPPIWAWLLAMAGMLVWLMPRGWPLRWAGLLLWLPLLLPTQVALQPGQMRVTVLDVGQGLSVLVQTAHHTMLYDAGPAYNEESDAGQRIVLPYLRHLGVSHLDAVVISHDDNDHSGGMASVLAGVSVDNFLSSLTPASDFFKQIQTLPNPPVLRPQPCYQGQQWQWDNISFRMLSPEKNTDTDLKDNDKSCVLQVQSPHGSLLLTGDIEKEAERRLLASEPDQLATTVMTMPHHGSKTSSTIGFVNATKPAIAIATVGYLNRFGHPKPEVISRYQAIETTVLRSDNDGAILIDFLSGEAPVVKRWRQIEPHYWEL
ncbi:MULTISPECIES: DNA internalization-related competence protein ComEC/Rec2 [unclassified Methylophilus]|uniref:DNA internalization-related competence protein ComEC/Rec2 n=1 Tax=unclassified Methylophilus TaxID=2630143 RepID=UPI0006FF79B6|nr:MULTISPECIES: DNA internalization-related competence protein ComEC/Rec2 [unclassified Methylophilus]KQT43741.1 DNA internalization-related competence protein ComEC/Rec2 [Methylophilus sp. Leaf416]KQT59226.1 DNA internalization-related competence protein ComEC/Rec2 [Methylophilus sp. Leaf459]